MHIHQRIESTLRFEVEGVSLLGGSKYELYLKQPFGVFYQFTPEIINENTFDVTIPYEAAMELTTGTVNFQLAFRTAEDTPVMGDTCIVDVQECQKRGGYHG